ncbi:hypothetical protein DL240_07315 [Lujinxingia litoralis]|uniref:Uncharacterized protein n=1 Tax=Lujinxingia litoralis TaxID=2211119 RepID=A0A328CBS3_9DELT|nr:hypothetical protein [Lujinxingia litoralis]RAL23949.1 hypothetical protein DL240_07315 [Lujinxingia litoralis]
MAIWAEKLAVRVGRNEVWAGVTLRAESGVLVVVPQGRSEARRALMMTLLGRKKAASGACGLDGLEGAVGYVPEGECVYGGMKVARLLGYAAELGLRALDVEARGARIEAVIQELGLAEVREAKVRELDEVARWKVTLGEAMLLGARGWLVEIAGADSGAKLEVMRGLVRGGVAAVVCMDEDAAVALVEATEHVCVPGPEGMGFWGNAARWRTCAGEAL